MNSIQYLGICIDV